MTITVDDWRTMLHDKEAFLERVVDPMTGWLNRYAAKRTIDLLAYQESNEVAGSLYEVGLYHGKYFSLLARSAAITRSNLVGLDLFDYITEGQFREYFDNMVSPRNLAEASPGFQWSIIGGTSADINARRLLAELGTESRFISIDGSHEYDDVLWDLRVAEQLLAPGGVISADDFINPICLGVTAAIYHFLEYTPTLVPFAHISNKLFLCHHSWADRYRSNLESAILADVTEQKSRDYRKQFDAGTRRNIEAIFRNYRILSIRM